MATVIKIKSTNLDKFPVDGGGDSVLATGELAYSYYTGAQNNNGDRIYIGTGTETNGVSADVAVIGGKYFTDMLDHVHGTLTASSGVIVDSNLKIDQWNVDNIKLNGNTISIDQTSDANGTLTIQPGGTGDEIVLQATTVTINGNLDLTGTQTFTGDMSVIGNFDVSGGQAEIASLNVEDLTNNRIVIAGVDGELEDDANFRFDGTNFDIGGAGSEVFRVAVASGNTTIEGTADVTGNLAVNTNKFTVAAATGNTLVAGTLNVTSDVAINTNKFTVTAATGNTAIAGTLDVVGQAEVGSLNVEDLTPTRVVFAGADGELVDDGNFTFDSTSDKLDITGSLEVDNITLDANTIATTTGGLDIAPAASGVVDFTNTSAIKVPVGNTSQRPTAETGLIRYNTTTSQYEGYSSSAWQGLGGVIDVDQDTYVIAQVTPSLVDPGDAANTLYFVTNSNRMMEIDSSGITFDPDNATADVKIVNSTLSTSSGPLYLDPGRTGDETGGTVIVNGDFQVNGTTTTVNSTEITVDDPVFTLGGDTPPASDDNLDRGIQFRWHDGSAAKVGFFGWDDSASRFKFIDDASNSSEVFSGAAGDVEFGNALVDSVTFSATNYTATSIPAIDGNGNIIFIEETTTGLGQYGTEGQVLQMNSSGVPFFGHIDGGTY
jgi:hypothetical protein